MNDIFGAVLTKPKQNQNIQFTICQTTKQQYKPKLTL